MKGSDLALILTGVTLNAVAQLLLKAGAGAIDGVALRLANVGVLAQRLLFNPPILGGLACYAVSVVVWIVALSSPRVPVSMAYPLLSVGYVLNALAAWWLFSEQLGPQRLAGIGVIMAGVWLITRG